MAKKKTKKHSHRRRRSVSGIGNINGLIMQAAGVAAGAFAANALNKAIGPNVPSKILNIGMVVGGAMLVPKLVKGPIGAAIGNGLVAVGTLRTLQGFGVISGIGDDGDTLTYAVSGAGELQLIGDDGSAAAADDGVSGFGDFSMISGADDDE